MLKGLCGTGKGLGTPLGLREGAIELFGPQGKGEGWWKISLWSVREGLAEGAGVWVWWTTIAVCWAAQWQGIEWKMAGRQAGFGLDPVAGRIFRGDGAWSDL